MKVSRRNRQTAWNAGYAGDRNSYEQGTIFYDDYCDGATARRQASVRSAVKPQEQVS